MRVTGRWWCHGAVTSGVTGAVTVAVTAVLKARPQRISYPDIPVPFAPEMEHAVLPSAGKIVAAVQRILGGNE